MHGYLNLRDAAGHLSFDDWEDHVFPWSRDEGGKEVAMKVWGISGVAPL